jgi:hypothetical protein
VAGLLVLIVVGVWAVIHFRNQGNTRTWSVAPGHRESFHLKFNRGKKVEVWLDSKGNANMGVYVYDAQNRLVASRDGNGGGCYLFFVPPVTQTYRLEVQNRDNVQGWADPTTGTLRFRESEHVGPIPMVVVPPPNPPNPGFVPQPAFPNQAQGIQRPPQVIALQPGPGGATQWATLNANDGTDARRGGSFCKVYTYPMLAGRQYIVDLQSAQFDSYLFLDDANGVQLSCDDDSGGNLNARIVFVPARDGTYRIVATTFAQGQVGNYMLSIRP